MRRGNRSGRPASSIVSRRRQTSFGQNPLNYRGKRGRSGESRETLHCDLVELFDGGTVRA